MKKLLDRLAEGPMTMTPAADADFYARVYTVMLVVGVALGVALYLIAG